MPFVERPYGFRPPAGLAHRTVRIAEQGTTITMRRLALTSLLALSLGACAAAPKADLAAAPCRSGSGCGTPAPAGPAPLSDLVAKVDIPYEKFTWPNSLTVLVHTDRKAPIVGVTLYYRVGSKA